ncbi:MAG: type II toxin-antitoxin system RelE/ParE family toxin [Luteibacter sp.]
MIKSYGDADSGIFHAGGRVLRWLHIERTLYRKLVAIHRATTLSDLREPPANRLKPLRGDRSGQYSIRVNDQYRVCFVWRDGHAYDVSVVDYH